MRVWDVTTGRTARLLHGHAAFVSDAAFSADGRWVVSAGPGRQGPALLPGRHLGPINAAAFAPSGWRLATAGFDGSIRTYTCTLCGKTPELVALTQHRLAGLAGP